jgi:hypothetical protein
MHKEHETIIDWPEVLFFEEPLVECELLDAFAGSDLAILDLVDLSG